MRCANAKTVVLTLIGIVISHDSLQRVFLGKGLGPERMFETYLGFAMAEQAATEETMVRLQHIDTAVRAIGAE